MSKRILVTGANGFVGKHLVHGLKSADFEVVGLGTSEAAHPSIKDELTDYITCDLNDSQAVSRLALNTFDGVINLAGLAVVGDSFKNPEQYMRANVVIINNLGQALLDKNPNARLIAVSTGTVYDPQQAMPLTEGSKLVREGSPYTLSKIAMEKIARELISSGLNCVIVRPFNHIGPGQTPGFLIPDLVTKIKQAKQSSGVIEVGNLSTKRDFTDVRDVVKAYVALLQTDKLNFDTYNICSGTSHSGQEILDYLLSEMGLSGKISTKVNQSLLRPNDPKDLYGSNAKIHSDTGWQTQIPLKQTIVDFIAAA